MINTYFIWLIWHYTVSTREPLADFKKQSYYSLFHFSMVFFSVSFSYFISTACLWIALIQTDGHDNPFYLCFLISLKIPPYLKYNKRTEVLSKELWPNGCEVDAITWKGTLCCQIWKVHVSAWGWRKMNYAKQSNWEADVAKFGYFVVSTLNASWWPGAIFKPTETKL